MGRKIFVSYKYADDQVGDLSRSDSGKTTVRDYVNEIEEMLRETSNVFKGEHDGEDLSELSDEAIWEALKDKIYDSALTIVLISPGMREESKPDRDQWIPWEIAYSLRETSRRDTSGNPVTSGTNAMMAVVLPDAEGGYGYYLAGMDCCGTRCTMHHTERLFDILRKNKFNKRSAQKRTCERGSEIWHGGASYIEAVRWDAFASDPEKYISKAYTRLDDIESYEIVKTV